MTERRGSVQVRQLERPEAIHLPDGTVRQVGYRLADLISEFGGYVGVMTHPTTGEEIPISLEKWRASDPEQTFVEIGFIDWPEDSIVVTAEVRAVVEAAQEEANQRGEAPPRWRHVLLALISNRETAIREALLEALGESKLSEIASRFQADSSSEQEGPLLEVAATHARRRGETMIGLSDLFEALVAHPNSPLGRTIRTVLSEEELAAAIAAVQRPRQ